MKTHNIVTLALIAVLSFLFIGCEKTGESFVNLPEGPKIIFRGGVGKITIRYTPPPDPIFKISNATEYVEFETIKSKYGIPDKPIIVDYAIETSVMNAFIAQRTNNPQFNDYIVRAIQSWMYTPYGKGEMKVAVDVAKKRIIVDARNIKLIEQEPGRPVPKLGNARDMVRQIGFTIVEGSLY